MTCTVVAVPDTNTSICSCSRMNCGERTYAGSLRLSDPVHSPGGTPRRFSAYPGTHHLGVPVNTSRPEAGAKVAEQFLVVA